jgi:hypothetical protein
MSEGVNPGGIVGRATAFYTMADSTHFLGVVGLVNSLRLLGHREEILILDCGLSLEQRELLAPCASVIVGSNSTHPTLLKAHLPLVHPANVMIVLDADVIVTRSLTSLIEQARYGRIIVFRNDQDRHKSEWGPALGLGRIKRRPYINAGHFILPRDLGLSVLYSYQEAVAKISLPRNGPPRSTCTRDIFYYSDQDVLNAVLGAKVPESQILYLSPWNAAFTPFKGVRTDLATLRSSFDDEREIFLLHHILDKPWLSPQPDSPYSVLLRRLLNSEDVAIRIPQKFIPLRLRFGTTARAAQALASLRATVRRNVRGRLGIVPRIRKVMARVLP